MDFTIEEINLMCIYHVTGHGRLMSAIRESLPDMDEPELRELAHQVLSCLEGMSDEAFDALDLTLTDNFDEEV